MSLQDEIATIAAEQHADAGAMLQAITNADSTMEAEATGLNADFASIDAELSALPNDMREENEAEERVDA